MVSPQGPGCGKRGERRGRIPVGAENWGGLYAEKVEMNVCGRAFCGNLEFFVTLSQGMTSENVKNLKKNLQIISLFRNL